MVITYHGHECFKLSLGDFLILINPPSKESSLRPPKCSPKIVLSTSRYKKVSGVDQYRDTSFVVEGPGVYEIEGIIIRGYPVYSNLDRKEYVNTIYSFSFDGMSICFLGSLSKSELPHDFVNDIDEVDIVFIPISGDDVLDSHEAAKFVVKLEPSVIIPTQVGDASLAQFLKEIGSKSVPIDKYTVKKKDIIMLKSEVVVLNES